MRIVRAQFCTASECLRIAHFCQSLSGWIFTWNTLASTLTFSSSFVFDNNFETGITMSQSSKHIRTEAKTWTKKRQSVGKKMFRNSKDWYSYRRPDMLSVLKTRWYWGKRLLQITTDGLAWQNVIECFLQLLYWERSSHCKINEKDWLQHMCSYFVLFLDVSWFSSW